MYQCSHRGAKTTPTNTHGIDCNVNNYTKKILECKAFQCEKKLMIVNMYLFGRLRVDCGVLSKLYLCVIGMSVVSAFGFISISHNTDI